MRKINPIPALVRTLNRSLLAHRRPLKLALTKGELVFASARELDFCLAARTASPAARLREMFARPVSELDAETETLRNQIIRLSTVLEDHRQGKTQLCRALRRLSPQMLTKDYEWRRIFEVMLATPPAAPEFLEIALGRYVEYLEERQRSARSIARQRSREDSDAAELATAALNVVSLERPEDLPALQRLPQGKPVILRLEPGREVMIKLARHDFALAREPDWSLKAETGERFDLHAGTNCVGRSRVNEFAVNSSLKQVSRKHLIAEPLGADMIALTDVSTGGTFIPPEALAS